MRIGRSTLRAAKPENLLRLARSLHLNTDGMSHRQVAALGVSATVIKSP